MSEHDPDRPGVVFLVGGGPGDPGLVTRRGAEVLASADCVVYDGLVSSAVLALAAPGAERIYAGKKRAEGGEPLTQPQINALLIGRARAGQRVVRLKGGDPFVFGRGAEEAVELSRAGIRFEVVPGVSAATAVPAYAGIPLTARGVSSTVALVPGHEDPEKLTSAIDWSGVARAGTAVLFMALANIEVCVRSLVAAGRAESTPAAAIYWGTTGAQRTVRATLGALPAACRAASLRPPVLVVIGEVVALRESVSWFETRPLFGKRVLFTREGRRAHDLARAISELGGEPVAMPVTRVVAAGDGDHLDRMVSGLAGGEYDWVLFASSNAVDFFMASLMERGGDARSLAGARLATVGDKTAAALKRYGLRADAVSTHGHARALAQTVVQASGASSPSAMRVLLPRAEDGRPELVGELAAAGMHVDPVVVYRTRVAAPDAPVVADAVRKLSRGQVEVVLCFAPSQVRALVDILGDGAAEALERVEVIGAIGATTAAAIGELIGRRPVVASSPDADVLLREVADGLRRGPRGE